MAVYRNSRYSFSEAIPDRNGKMFLTPMKPFRYKAFADNIDHTVRQGECIEDIVDQRYPSFPNAAQLYWVLCHFQKSPILDPTLPLTPGQVLVLPSAHTLRTVILNPERRNE